MSSVIDERVVQMSFDNDQFEKGVSQTINSLNKLDKTLVETTDGEYFTNMEDGIRRVEQAFSKSGMVINGILLSIGQTINQYITKGISALTSGIRGGLQEYETQMGATQTILANVKDEGKGIADVTAALDELNVYADKTIYNFTEMTRNIGMFTAAGANLDTSVATIKGLANAAALVGANATTAARAWYQVSQAMAAGTFKLMDWRSLEISNIAGEGFKSVLTEVARKDGVAIDSLIKKYGSLRDTLKEGWLTADRFAEAMKILSGDLTEEQIKALGYTDEQAKLLHELAQEATYAAIKVKTFSQLMETTAEAIGSGWAVTFRTIIGDFEKAREFYTRISVTINDIIDKISDYRNHLLDLIWNWKLSGDFSPYDNFKRTLDNLLAIFSTFVGAIRAGFDNIFKWDDMNSTLGKLTNFFKRVTDSFVLNDAKWATKLEENLDKKTKGLEEEVEDLTEFEKANYWDLDLVNDNIEKLIRVFRGLFAGVDLILRTVADTIGFIIGLIPGMDNFYDNLKNGNLDILSNLADMMDNITKIRNIIIDLNIIPRLLESAKLKLIEIITTNPLLMGLINTVLYVIAVIKGIVKTLKDFDISPLHVIFGLLKLIGSAILYVFQGISNVIAGVFSALTGMGLGDIMGALVRDIFVVIYLLGELGKGTITVSELFAYFKYKLLTAFEDIFNSPFIQGLVTFFVGLWDSITAFWNNVINVFDTIGTYLQEYFGGDKYNPEKFGIVALLTAAGIALYNLFTEGGGLLLLGENISRVIRKLGDVLSAYARKVNAEALMTTAKAVGIMAASVFALSLIPYDNLVNGISAFIIIAGSVMLLTKAIDAAFDALERVKKALDPISQMALKFVKALSAAIKRAALALVIEAVSNAIVKMTISLIALGLAFQFMPEAMQQAGWVLTAIASGIAAIAVGIYLLTNSVLKLKRVTKNTNTRILSQLADAAKQFVKMAGLAIVIETISNAIIKVAAAIALLAMIDKAGGNIQGALSVIAWVTAFFGALVIFVAKYGNTNIRASAIASLSLLVLSFGGVVTSLLAITGVLGLLPGHALSKGLVTVGTIMILLSGMISIIQATYNLNAEKTFIGLAAMFGSLSIGLAAMLAAASLIKESTQLEALSASITTLSIVLIGSIVGIMFLLEKLKASNLDDSSSRKALEVLATVAGSLSAVAIAFGAAGALMAHYGASWDQLIPLLTILSAVLIATAGIYATAMNNTTVLNENVLFSVMGIVLSMAATVVAIGFALSMIGDIEISSSVIGVLITIGAIIGILTGLLLALAGIFATDGITEIVTLAMAAMAGFFASIGIMIISIAGAVKIFQDVLVSGWDSLKEFAREGMAFRDTIIRIGKIVKDSIKDIYETFVSVGAGIGAAIAGINDGLSKMTTSILTSTIGFVFGLLGALATWINDNSEMIVNVLAELLKLIINLVIMAIEVVFIDAVPYVLVTLINILITFCDIFFGVAMLIIGGYFKAIGDMWNFFGLTAIADMCYAISDGFNSVASGFNDFVMSIKKGLKDILGWIDNVIGGIGYLKSAVGITEEETIKSNAQITNSFKNMAVDCMKISNKILDAGSINADMSTENAKKIEENNRAISISTGDMSNDVLKFFDNMTGGAISSFDLMSLASGDGMGDISRIISDSLGIDLDNTVEYFEDVLGIETDFQSWSYQSNVDYLNKQSEAIKEYYGDAGDKAVEYYTAMAELEKAHESGNKADIDQASAKLFKLSRELDGLGVTADQLLADSFDKNTLNLDKYKANEYESWTDILGDITKAYEDYELPEVDTSAYSPSYPSGSSTTPSTDTTKLQNELQNRNDLIKDADSEITPKDITPTIDLDSLKNEVNQANGIVTGSLLAAQNAAVGDYINQDSELNPFMKDRWQNTYNFTQNNYSPKALSRIDIYRQTQNQLRLSRGF